MKIKLFHAELSGQSFKAGFTKLDTDIMVEDDHSFEVEPALGEHLRKNCPFILTEEEYVAFSKQKGISLTKNDPESGENTGIYFNAEYVPTVPDPGKKIAQDKKKDVDVERLQADYRTLQKDYNELAAEVLELKSKQDGIGEDEAEKEISDLKLKVEGLENDKKSLSESNDKLRENFVMVEKANENLTKKLEEANKIIETKDGEINALKEASGKTVTTSDKTGEEKTVTTSDKTGEEKASKQKKNS